MKPILTLDFDGVLHSYASGWKGAANIPDPPNPGALEFLFAALEHFTVAVLSSRSHQWGGRRAMKRWLRDQVIAVGRSEYVPKWLLDNIAANHSMEPWEQEVEACADRLVKAIRWPLFKPSSMVTLDDRAVQFMGTWPDPLALKAFKPWNKRPRSGESSTNHGPG